MALSIASRQQSHGESRPVARRLGLALLAAIATVAFAISTVGGQAGRPAAAQGPTAEQRIAFVMEEHGYTARLAPTTAQRIAFQQEEHGYTGFLVPTARQRIAFVLEEHGYDVSRLVTQP